MDISRDISLKSEKGHLFLRPPLPEDVDAIYHAVLDSHQELSVWMDWCTPDYSKSVTVEWINQQPIAWAEGKNFQFAVFDSRDGSFLGSCGLNHINRYYLLANLGYWVRTNQTGKRVATEAAKVVAKFGFDSLKLRRIEIVTGVENLASRKVASNTGAVYEGTLRRRLKLGERNIDAAMYSLIPDDLADEDL